MSKELLATQFDNCYDNNGWFAALEYCLVGLTAEQAAWKPEGTENSIWAITAHLNYYNYAYLQRFKGLAYEYPKSTNEETFEAVSDATEDAWQAELSTFKEVMTGWREELRNAGAAKLDELTPPRGESPWWQIIGNINLHNAHHGGQIVLLRKLQGSWDPGKSVF